MRRPHTILGLTVAVIRTRGLARAVVVAAALMALVSAALLHHAWHLDALVDAQVAREASAWRSAPAEGEVFLGDASVIATPGGWLVAWTRRERAHNNVIQVAALDRTGALRGAPVTLSSTELFSRRPYLARGARGNAVVWASSAPKELAPHAWFTLVDDSAHPLAAPQQLGAADDESVGPQVAWDGEGWGVGWSRLRPTRGYTLVRLAADGALRGEPTRLDERHGWVYSALAWNGSAWLIAQSAYRPRADASAVRLLWIDRSGRPIAHRELARSSGELGDIVATARGASTWLVWGEDMGFTVRHDPRLARVDDRMVAQPSRSLGPRRSGSVPAITCVGDGCTLAWTAVPEGGNHPEYYVQRVDADGAPRSAPRRIGSEGHAWPRFAAAIATSLDDNEALAVWPAAHADRGGLLVVRLDANGAPIDPPRELLR